ncbi:hypothetical protein ACLQ2R_30545 [Streptosporangium sp. DT93]|uniref:hypothetical protein n=1 Tax=Streptosporangium sp. DT93 TaxID=3393428 RepID=UPI003CFB7D05
MWARRLRVPVNRAVGVIEIADVVAVEEATAKKSPKYAARWFTQVSEAKLPVNSTGGAIMREGDVAMFVDGPDHNAVEVKLRYGQAKGRLSEQGWLVFRYDGWEQLVRKFPSISLHRRRA